MTGWALSHNLHAENGTCQIGRTLSVCPEYVPCRGRVLQTGRIPVPPGRVEKACGGHSLCSEATVGRVTPLACGLSHSERARLRASSPSGARELTSWNLGLSVNEQVDSKCIGRK